MYKTKFLKLLSTGAGTSSKDTFLERYTNLTFVPFVGLYINFPNSIESEEILDVTYNVEEEEFVCRFNDNDTGRNYCHSNNVFSYADEEPEEPEEYEELRQEYFKLGWEESL